MDCNESANKSENGDWAIFCFNMSRVKSVGAHGSADEVRFRLDLRVVVRACCWWMAACFFWNDSSFPTTRFFRKSAVVVAINCKA